MKTREIAEFLNAELFGDGDVDIVRVAALESATKGEIAFVEKSGFEIATNAACLIVPHGFAQQTGAAQIAVPNPKLAFALVAGEVHPPKKRGAAIHPTAVIAETATIGKDVFIGAFVCVGENSIIGDNSQILAGTKIGDGVNVGGGSVLHPNVVIEDGCTLGDNVILHGGVVIGADGFGYVQDGRKTHHKFPQLGTVVIENNVEIGANTCIDRGALGETRIGMGTKIDNLVQIAHNVSIGKCVVIAAQTGISGSTVIEDDCVIGGQVGMGDHARVQSGAIIGSQAGVLPGKIVRPGVWWGTPVQPLDEYKRQNAHIKGLGRLKDDVKKLKKKLSE
jgi:UDP-3-O-[3-hydroxymyristoyl] glucosamine N-acyltransferase